MPYTYTFNVVPEIVTRFTVSPPRPPAMHVGQTLQLDVVAYDRQGNVLVRTPIWTNSNPAVATVSESGLVTARAVGSTSLAVQFPSSATFVAAPIQVVP